MKMKKRSMITNLQFDIACLKIVALLIINIVNIVKVNNDWNYQDSLAWIVVNIYIMYDEVNWIDNVQTGN